MHCAADTMPFKSLFDLASRTCIKNIKHLDSVGDFLPYEKVRHLLVRVEDADQLHEIEVNSPQIQGRTGELWLRLIEKDFPLEFRAKAYKPVDPTKWHRVYKKYKKEHDEKEQEAMRQLRATMNGLKEDKAKATTRIISRGKLPNQPGMGAKRGAGGRRLGASSGMAFTAGTRTKVSSGKSVIKKAKREAKDIANIKGSLSRHIGAPRAQSQITRAPQGMIDAHRRAALPGVRQVEEPKPKVQKVPEAVRAHEERASFISDSEDDDELFDEEPRPRKTKPFANSASKVSPSKPASRPFGSAAASLLKTRPKTTPTNRFANVKTEGHSSSSGKAGAQRPPPRSSSLTASSSVQDKMTKSEPKMVKSEASSSRPRAASPPEPKKETGSSQPPAAPPPRPMKRKAPSLFMKPNKRVH